MKKLLWLFFFAGLFASCKKDSNEDRVLNGVNVNAAVTKLNSYRTQGITGYPATTALTWNDTLSNAAYNFAKAKALDPTPATSTYYLSNGQFILQFPATLQFSKTAFFALHYAYPSSTDVGTVIAAGFTSTDATIRSGLMSATAKQFGLGQYNDRWYLIYSN